MAAALNARFLGTLSRLSIRRFFVLRADDGKPMGLLPGGRLASAVFPVVSSPSRAARRGDDLRGGVVGEGFGKGHGRTVSRKKKLAMPKIILVTRRHCLHIACISNASDAMKGKQYLVLVMGTETWVRIRKSEIQTLKNAGYNLTFDEREAAIFVEVAAR